MTGKAVLFAATLFTVRLCDAFIHYVVCVWLDAFRFRHISLRSRPHVTASQRKKVVSSCQASLILLFPVNSCTEHADSLHRIEFSLCSVLIQALQVLTYKNGSFWKSNRDGCKQGYGHAGWSGLVLLNPSEISLGHGPLRQILTNWSKSHTKAVSEALLCW